MRILIVRGYEEHLLNKILPIKKSLSPIVFYKLSNRLEYIRHLIDKDNAETMLLTQEGK
jgi:hypothetical protein